MPFFNVSVSLDRERVGGHMIQNLATTSSVEIVILMSRTLCLTHCLPICPSA